MPIEVLRSALDDLARLSLLQRSHLHPDSVRAIDPRVGVEALALQRKREIEQSQAAFALFLEQQANQRSPIDRPEGEVLEGIDVIRARLKELAESCQWEACALMPGGAQSPEALAASRVLDQEAIERGVRMRTVYLDSIRSDPATLAYAQWLQEEGAEVRTAPTLPVRLLIVDRRVAIVPTKADESRESAIVITSSGMVTALLALFNTVRKGATLFGSHKPRDEAGLSDRERQVLRLLAEGRTDEMIARRLAVSVRTARRITSDLLDRLDASSRFEAGAKAATRGWISPADLD